MQYPLVFITTTMANERKNNNKSLFNLLHAIVDTNDPEKSSIYVGSEDPVYEIWLASMQVPGACVRTSSHYFNDLGGDNLGTGFLNMSIEFLIV